MPLLYPSPRYTVHDTSPMRACFSSLRGVTGMFSFHAFFSPIASSSMPFSSWLDSFWFFLFNFPFPFWCCSSCLLFFSFPPNSRSDSSYFFYFHKILFYFILFFLILYFFYPFYPFYLFFDFLLLLIRFRSRCPWVLVCCDYMYILSTLVTEWPLTLIPSPLSYFL